MRSPVAGSLKRDLLFALLGAIILNAFMALTFLDKIKVPKTIEDAFLALCLPTLLVMRHVTVGNLVVLIALAVALNVALHGSTFFILCRIYRWVRDARPFRTAGSR